MPAVAFDMGPNMQIEIKGIAKKYGKKEVLRDISFSAESGKCIGILGSNGCGKSTLLSILAGIQPTDCGEFLISDKDLFKYPTARAGVVGYIPQGTPLIEELTAKDNLSLWYSKEQMQKELQNGVLKMLGIDEFLKVPVNKMSGGMKKRLSIGCSIAKRPAILLMDEPMAALDISCKQKIASYIKRHKQAGGVVIIASHDVMELELCDVWYIMKDGVLCEFDYDGDLGRLVENL